MDTRLLKIIKQQSARSGFADGESVARLYGEGFNEALMALHMEGYLTKNTGPVGTISLSAAGRVVALNL